MKNCERIVKIFKLLKNLLIVRLVLLERRKTFWCVKKQCCVFREVSCCFFFFTDNSYCVFESFFFVRCYLFLLFLCVVCSMRAKRPEEVRMKVSISFCFQDLPNIKSCKILSEKPKDDK